MASFFNFAASCAVTAGSVFLSREFINRGCYGFAFLTFWFGLDLSRRIVKNETKSNITVEFDEKSKNTKKKQKDESQLSEVRELSKAQKDNNLNEAQKDNNLNKAQKVHESDAQHKEDQEDQN